MTPEQLKKFEQEEEKAEKEKRKKENEWMQKKYEEKCERVSKRGPQMRPWDDPPELNYVEGMSIENFYAMPDFKVFKVFQMRCKNAYTV
jgi:hypothetical protein